MLNYLCMSMEGNRIDDDDSDTPVLRSSIEEDLSDSDDDLLQMENITDPDTSIEIIETVTRDMSNVNDTETPGQIVTKSPSPAGYRDTSDYQAESGRMVLRNCSVLVKKSRLGEMRKRKRGMDGDESGKGVNLDCLDEEQNVNVVATRLGSKSEERSVLGNSFDGSCASKSSNLSSICAQTTSLPSSSEKGGHNGNVGKYDCFM